MTRTAQRSLVALEEVEHDSQTNAKPTEEDATEGLGEPCHQEWCEILPERDSTLFTMPPYGYGDSAFVKGLVARIVLL